MSVPGHGYGCPRHEDDPHFLCPACWALEPEPGDVLFELLADEIARQDAKHGPFTGSHLGRSRLAIACLEDEVEELRQAWRAERKLGVWKDARTEALQVAAVAMRALRDSFSQPDPYLGARSSNDLS